MAENKMKAGDNPADFKVSQVNDFLATADDAEKARVLEAETTGEARKGVLAGPHAEPTQKEPVGLAATGNPNDLATPVVSTAPGIAHQEGAPPELAEVADKATEAGYLGTTPSKPDYSQANPAVMNQEG